MNTYQTGEWRESTAITASDILMIETNLDSEHRNEDFVQNDQQ